MLPCISNRKSSKSHPQPAAGAVRNLSWNRSHAPACEDRAAADVLARDKRGWTAQSWSKTLIFTKNYENFWGALDPTTMSDSNPARRENVCVFAQSVESTRCRFARKKNRIPIVGHRQNILSEKICNTKHCIFYSRTNRRIPPKRVFLSWISKCCKCFDVVNPFLEADHASKSSCGFIT